MAMKFYLEKKREHDSFIAQERSEFELGKKHLANMMGMEAEAMTQEDIDKAIDYLFPSGLFHPEARPVMKPPEDVSITFSFFKYLVCSLILTTRFKLLNDFSSTSLQVLILYFFHICGLRCTLSSQTNIVHSPRVTTRSISGYCFEVDK